MYTMILCRVSVTSTRKGRERKVLGGVYLYFLPLSTLFLYLDYRAGTCLSSLASPQLPGRVGLDQGRAEEEF